MITSLIRKINPSNPSVLAKNKTKNGEKWLFSLMTFASVADPDPG